MFNDLFKKLMVLKLVNLHHIKKPCMHVSMLRPFYFSPVIFWPRQIVPSYLSGSRQITCPFVSYLFLPGKKCLGQINVLRLGKNVWAR